MDPTHSIFAPSVFLGPSGIKAQLTKLVLSRAVSKECRTWMKTCKSVAQEGKKLDTSYCITNIVVLMDFATRLWENNHLPNLTISSCEDEEAMYRCRVLSWVIFNRDSVRIEDTREWAPFSSFVSHLFKAGIITMAQQKEYLLPIIPREAKAKLLSANPFSDLRIPHCLSFAIECRDFNHEGSSCCDLLLVPIYKVSKTIAVLTAPVIDEECVVAPSPDSVVTL